MSPRVAQMIVFASTRHPLDLLRFEHCEIVLRYDLEWRPVYAMTVPRHPRRLAPIHQTMLTGLRQIILKLTAVLMAAAATFANAANLLMENFDLVSNLPGNGWTIVNNSSPIETID